jgi:hypothetical protein
VWRMRAAANRLRLEFFSKILRRQCSHQPGGWGVWLTSACVVVVVVVVVVGVVVVVVVVVVV